MNLDDFYLKLKNDLRQFKHDVVLSLDTEQKMFLKKNVQYKDKYKNKRCFIIGNGPSLKKQNLKKVSDDIVFTVNLFPKSPLYRLVKSDFHVMIDPFIFNLDLNREEDRDKLETFRKINTTESEPICFFPYVAKSMLEEHGLSSCLSISYLGLGCTFYEGYNAKIDLTKHIPCFRNVVQYAIIIAVYMGFQDIFLMGCDMTGYEQISVLAGKEIELHAYEMDNNEKQAIKNTHLQVSPEYFFEGFYKTFADYRRLYDYAGKRNINLYNATCGGVLQSIPRVDYDKLF